MTDQTQALLDELNTHYATLTDLGQVSALLGWDEHVNLPPAAPAARGQQRATLGRIMHARATGKPLAQLLDKLEAADLPADSVAAASLRQARRDYNHAVKLPPYFVEELSHHSSHANAVWVQARQDNDFATFAPVLRKSFELARQQADYLGYDDHPYNALHDLYELGSDVTQLRSVFDTLRAETVPLVKAIAESQAGVNDSLLRQPFDEGKQEAFAREAIAKLGYDFDAGRLDRTVHPFAQSISKYDVRITTRYAPDFLSTALFGTLHEAGHAMYEQGLGDAHYRSALGQAVSLGFHESQSRLWENLVGRSRNFWEWAYPNLQATFSQLKNTSLDDFYRAINKVEASLIRVEADEITYNLHIMIRFELELALLEGSLKVNDLPGAWNAKYQDYLGVTPPDDAAGCLQDIHWSMGAIGYFPTYTLGNVMSVQLFEAAKKARPSIKDDMKSGQFNELFKWLREHVHQHGSRYTPAELLKHATGETLNATPYVTYLKGKFGAIYGLEIPSA